ncbi:MAG: nucleoside triphosphate pyrophosphohydrolase [Oscillospiraceae bacterium]|nr:nucleoside triphosphate pyrophosphohydrolase [Oscillospiraceae bacterium]
MVDFEYKAHYDVNDYRRIIRLLRGEGGCPWDREQTHESIRRNLLEEAYEVCEAIDEGSPEHLREELGDLLMQVLFHADIESDAGRFDLDDVADTACKKLILRHPHVFGSAQVSSSAEVLENWDAIKRVEKNQRSTGDAMDSVARSLPALWRAEKIQSKAQKAGFDWPDADAAADMLREEIAGVEDAMHRGEGVEEALGDAFFALTQVARLTGTDPEMALHEACERFIRRFRFMEAETDSRGKSLKELSGAQQEELYRRSERPQDD